MKALLSWFAVVVSTIFFTLIVGYVAYHNFNEYFEIITLLGWIGSLGIAKQVAYNE